MIRTKNSIKKIPSAWVFEHYCKLTEKLHGQDIKIQSIFNPGERTPSMAIYYKDSGYRFKDFSTGTSGDTIDLVAAIHKVSYDVAKNMMLTAYEKIGEEDYEDVALNEKSKFKVSSHTRRRWNQLDGKYWTQFGIGSKMLERYNVIPLQGYGMSKMTDNGIVQINITGQHIYGYFKANGELYKLYQPMRPDYKFLNVQPYVQGSEQLSYSKSTLIICSSLKDLMAIKSLEIPIEAVAPASENTLLQKPVLASYALKYNKIITLFDNDNAGHLAMNTYKEKYGIPGVFLNMSKDVSDSIRDFGAKKTRQQLKLLIPNT